MEVYFKVFVHWEQNNWKRLFPMAKFTINNAINASIDYSLFVSYYGFNPRVLFKKDVKTRSKCHLANKLADKLAELTEICYQNLLQV